MSVTQLMTNEEVLTAAGVSASEIAAIKTADATTQVNTLDAIFNKLMSFVYAHKIELANSRNPFSVLERSYASMNGGSLNGLFQETLVPYREKGTNELYGGSVYSPTAIKNPWTTQDYGADPIQYTFGINAKVERDLDYDRIDFLMALNNEALGSFISAKLATLAPETLSSNYIIENKVLNCENYQYTNYSSAASFDNSYDMNNFIHKVITDQDYPDTNITYKRTKFNTTRGAGDIAIILQKDWWFDYCQRFQFKQYLKPIIFKSQDRDTYGSTQEVNRIILVDSLMPTTVASGSILNPLSMTTQTLPTNTELVGRLVDVNAIKFGIGTKSAVSFPLNSRTSHFTEATDYCFNMCDAYVNVPLLASTTFDKNRIVYTESVSE